MVIAAGHGSKALGAMVGLDVPVHPEHRQILVTERAAPLLAHPTLHVRQTDEGSLRGAGGRDMDPRDPGAGGHAGVASARRAGPDADARTGAGADVDAGPVGHHRIRPPVKPLTVGELAALEDAGPPRETVQAPGHPRAGCRLV